MVRFPGRSKKKSVIVTENPGMSQPLDQIPDFQPAAPDATSVDDVGQFFQNYQKRGFWCGNQGVFKPFAPKTVIKRSNDYRHLLRNFNPANGSLTQYLSDFSSRVEDIRHMGGTQEKQILIFYENLLRANDLYHVYDENHECARVIHVLDVQHRAKAAEGGLKITVQGIEYLFERHHNFHAHSPSAALACILNFLQGGVRGEIATAVMVIAHDPESFIMPEDESCAIFLPTEESQTGFIHYKRCKIGEVDNKIDLDSRLRR
jgi:hypothetical protein